MIDRRGVRPSQLTDCGGARTVNPCVCLDDQVLVFTRTVAELTLDVAAWEAAVEGLASHGARGGHGGEARDACACASHGVCWSAAALCSTTHRPMAAAFGIARPPTRRYRTEVAYERSKGSDKYVE